MTKDGVKRYVTEVIVDDLKFMMDIKKITNSAGIAEVTAVDQIEIFLLMKKNEGTTSCLCKMQRPNITTF